MTVTAQRRHLPNHRRAETLDIECHGMKFVATFSRFADGEVAEVFLSNHKTGSHADINARDLAIAASLALQYGAPSMCCAGHYFATNTGPQAGRLAPRWT